jgi:hypothetical protein
MEIKALKIKTKVNFVNDSLRQNIKQVMCTKLSLLFYLKMEQTNKHNRVISKFFMCFYEFCLNLLHTNDYFSFMFELFGTQYKLLGTCELTLNP